MESSGLWTAQFSGFSSEATVDVPEEYKGREQSLIKHRVLAEYLLGWGHKLGSAAQKRPVRLCYIDGFAGPWKSQSATLDDTSIAIGLRALEAAANTWSERGAKIAIEASFVEKDPSAFAELHAFLKVQRGGRVQTRAHNGEFGSFVPDLQRWIGNDAALIFVDPTGWKGAAMHYIEPLVAHQPRRDVLVNVMFDHINRFKDDPRQFLRDQMRDFFGLGNHELPEGLGEEELFTLYRTKLKERCGVTYAADLAIPHPTDDRTKFRLVVGGKNPAVLELFRDIEKKVVGSEAAQIRDDAAARKLEGKTGQLTLGVAPSTDARYESLHRAALDEAPDAIRRVIARGPTTFGALWPALLEDLHITTGELARVAWELHRAGAIVVTNATPRERTMKDHHELRAGSP
jgi:three-Cys-motif partner protein